MGDWWELATNAAAFGLGVMAGMVLMVWWICRDAKGAGWPR